MFDDNILQTSRQNVDRHLEENVRVLIIKYYTSLIGPLTEISIVT